MSTPSLNRRQVITGAGVAAAGAAATMLTSASPAAADEEGHGDLTGSWLAVRQDDGSPEHVRLVFSFAAGGVVISHDIAPADAVFTGTWSRGQRDEWHATFWTGNANPPASTVRVHVEGHLQHEGIFGTYRFTVFDAASGAVVFAGTGSFHGRPISA